MDELDLLLKSMTSDIPALSLTVGQKGRVVYSKFFGKIHETHQKISADTRFDIASITKILSGICFFRMVEDGKIRLHDPVYLHFPEFDRMKPIEKDGNVIGQCDARKITWYHILTHTAGFGWTRARTRPSLPHLDQGLSDIFDLPMACDVGKHIIYSDIGIILMGIVLERISGKPLDVLVDETICRPLELNHTGYLRRSLGHSGIITVPTEYDDVFRRKRIWGEVHDENAWLLDGVSAHAGIFSTSRDICRLAMHYQACLKKNGILRSDTVREMIRAQVCENGERRGLIWQLSGCGENAYTKYLSPAAYGHSGFTGCFLWADPQRDLSVCFLSNDIYNGRGQQKLSGFRQQIFKTIVALFVL